MHEAYAASSVTANRRGGGSCTTFSETCTISHQISALYRSLYPHKTWSVVAGLLGLSERAAKYRMSAARPYTTDEIQTLLQSDAGYEILELLMTDAKPRWWSMITETMALARARHHQELARQEVLRLDNTPLEVPTRRKAKRIADADRQLNSTRARQETALGILLADGSRAVSGTVAETKAQIASGRGGRR